MNREYHVEKDLKGQYLWIDREGIWGEAYEENILRKQKITGLIPFYETENMGEVHLVYPASGSSHGQAVSSGSKNQNHPIAGF